MRGENIDIVRKMFYKVFELLRGKGFTGAEVAMGLWEARGLDLIYNLLKKGYRLYAPTGEEMGWEDIGPIQKHMETMAVDNDDEKPDCFCTKKVRAKKGVPRYDCVLCVWQLPCMEAYKKKRESIKERKKKKKKKKRSKK